MQGGRTMGEYSEAFVAFDVAKTKHAVAIADGGRGSEVRFLGEVANTPAAVERLIRKLAGRYNKLHLCTAAWLFAGLQRYGWPVICIDARHAAAAPQAGSRIGFCCRSCRKGGMACATAGGTENEFLEIGLEMPTAAAVVDAQSPHP